MKKLFMLFVLVSLGYLASSYQIVLKTSLQVKILNRLGNPVEGAEVTLYINKEDYESSENPVAPTQTTDSKGQVLFKDIQPTAYYVNAKKGQLSNYGDAEITDTLTAGRRNKVTIIIN